MFYISFHGGDPGVNNIYTYQDTGKPHNTSNLLPTEGSNPDLKELRAFQIVGNFLYVVNGYKEYSQLLVYKSDGSGGYLFKEIYASKKEIKAIFHPYDLAIDSNGNCYISSQDSNVVTGLKAANTPMTVAPYLDANYAPQGNFLAGTRVASSIGKLPKGPTTSPPNVPLPQGLGVNYTDSKDSKIAHSVRGILCYDDYLIVSDEPANSVKLYILQSGELHCQIKGSNLSSPVQLLLNGGILYIGSSGSNKVLTYDLNSGVPSGVVSPSTFIEGIKHISGMTFDSDGNFYAAERKDKKIKKFKADGSGGKTFISNLPDCPEFIQYVQNAP